MQTPLTCHNLPKFPVGNSTSLEGEILGDHLQEEEGEEDNRPVHQGHPQETLWEAEEAEEVVEAEEEEHSHYLGKHLPMLLKNSLEMRLLSSQETALRSTLSSHSGNYIAA